MSGFVLDASVALAWFIEDEGNAAADRILEHLSTTPAIVPALFPLEIGNALLAAERRGRITAAHVARSFLLLDELRIQIDSAPPTTRAAELTALARTAKLSVYDAAYLALALREATPLATFDAALSRAARQAGVRLLVRI